MALFGLGSQSSDFTRGISANHPLPSCPRRPNCIRIGRSINAPKNTVLERCVNTLQTMQPESLEIEDQRNRIRCVFNVFIFKDDLIILLEPAPNQSATRLYLRSASRMGAIDFGVNRRRVQHFLDKMKLKR